MQRTSGSGVALDSQRVLHLYRWQAKNGYIKPAVTVCAELCDGWTRVLDSQWDSPPRGRKRCGKCERGKR